MLSGCGVLSEYSYLVKKVVFKIEILPAVKMISALFIHLFFVGIALLLFLIYGKLSRTAYAWQVFYYTFCMWMLALGISYADQRSERILPRFDADDQYCHAGGQSGSRPLCGIWQI